MKFGITRAPIERHVADFLSGIGFSFGCPIPLLSTTVGRLRMLLANSDLDWFIGSSHRSLTMPPLTSATASMRVVRDKTKNLEKYMTLIDKAASKKNLYIAFGFTERSRDWPNILFNSTALVGPEGFIGVHRKVHQPRCEYHAFFPGDSWSVYDTSIGRLGLLICHDMCFPEATRELALGGTEIYLFPTAWPLFSTSSEAVDAKAEIVRHRSGMWIFNNLLKERHPETYSRIASQPSFHKPPETHVVRSEV